MSLEVKGWNDIHGVLCRNDHCNLDELYYHKNISYDKITP